VSFCKNRSSERCRLQPSREVRRDDPDDVTRNTACTIEIVDEVVRAVVTHHDEIEIAPQR
jgi:hypothetical protein